MDESSLDWESWTGDWVQCDEGVSLVGTLLVVQLSCVMGASCPSGLARHH